MLLFRPSAHRADRRDDVARAASRARRRQLAAGVVVVTVLAAVFASYLQPGLLVAIATRAWACF